MSAYLVKGKGWRFDFTKKGARYTGTWFKTKTEAKQAEAKKREEIKKQIDCQQGRTDIVFLDLLNKWLDHLQGYKSEEYYKTNRNLCRHWAALWGEKLCSEISQGMIEDRILERKKISGYAANKELTHLRALFNFGKRKKLFNGNPTCHLEFVPKVEKLKALTPVEDIEKAISVATQDTKDYLVAIADTMARGIEINRLEWKDVYLEENYLILYTRKKKGGNLTPRTVSLTGRLSEILYRRKKNRNPKYHWVFCNTYFDCKKRKWVTNQYKYRSGILATLCEKAGVKKFTFHDLRHSGASILAKQNVPLINIKKVLGHENLSTTQRYLHSASEHEKEAISVYEAVVRNSHTNSHTEAPQ